MRLVGFSAPDDSVVWVNPDFVSVVFDLPGAGLPRTRLTAGGESVIVIGRSGEVAQALAGDGVVPARTAMQVSPADAARGRAMQAAGE